MVLCGLALIIELTRSGSLKDTLAHEWKTGALITGLFDGDMSAWDLSGTVTGIMQKKQ